MRVVQTTLAIARPRDQVWDYVTDSTHDPEWMSDLAATEVKPGPVGVGFEITEIRQFGNRAVESQVRITAWEPPCHLRKTTAPGSLIGADARYDFEALGEETQLTVTYAIRGRGVGKLLEWWVVGPSLQQNVEKDVQRIKEILEAAQPGPRGG